MTYCFFPQNRYVSTSFLFYFKRNEFWCKAWIYLILYFLPIHFVIQCGWHISQQMWRPDGNSILCFQSESINPLWPYRLLLVGQVMRLSSSHRLTRFSRGSSYNNVVLLASYSLCPCLLIHQCGNGPNHNLFFRCSVLVKGDVKVNLRFWADKLIRDNLCSTFSYYFFLVWCGWMCAPG